MRVIFDRSAFHGARFDALANSPLRALVAQNKIAVYHTQVFLDETVAAYAARHKSSDWQSHLAFAVDICNGGIFLDKEEIWHNELVRGQGTGARRLLPNAANGGYHSLPGMLSKLREIAVTGDAEALFVETSTERQEIRRKKNNRRGIARGAREEVAEAKRAKRMRGSLAGYPFVDFKAAAFTKAGQNLMSLVDQGRHEFLAARWARKPERYPYYSAFVEGVVYDWYYASVKHNSPIDTNAQADYEQLAYLLWADVVVSNDESFLRSAFEELWAPRGKRLETAESFAALLTTI